MILDRRAGHRRAGALVPVHDEVDAIAAALALLIGSDHAWLEQSAAQLGFARHAFSPEAMRASVLAALAAGHEAAGWRSAEAAP